MTEEQKTELITKLEARYKNRCISLCKRICGRENGEEVFSDALAVVYRNAESLSGENAPHFLLKTVRNLALKKREYLSARKRGGNAEVHSLEEELFPAGENVVCDTPESLMEVKETAEQINAYLKNLSKDARMIFVCRCYFGMSVSQTAKHLKISESKVKTSLSRTRKELKDHLERNGLL